MRLFTGMCSDMTGLYVSSTSQLITSLNLAHLMFESIESSVAQGALVRSRNLTLVDIQRSLELSFDVRIVGVESARDRIRQGQRQSREVF